MPIPARTHRLSRGHAATAAAASVGTTAASEYLGASVEAEAATTARKLVKELEEFFKRQGWID